MWHIPHRTNTLRWALIICGVVIFLWMSPEDDHTWPVAALGLAAACIMVAWWTLGRFGGQQVGYGGLFGMNVIAGIITGASGAVIAALLMLLKNARHSHFFPDFPPEQIIAMLERAPVWGIAGGLTGLGLSLLLVSIKATEPPSHHHTNETDTPAA